MEDRQVSKETKETRKKDGLILIFTGHGKGKTTAAIGITMRAVGHGFKTCFIQFIKGSWKYGEMEAIAKFPDNIDFHVMGRGFTWKSDDLDKDRAVARKAWEKVKEVIFTGQYKMVILDEFTYLLIYDMIDRNDSLEFWPINPQICILLSLAAMPTRL